ncbi:serine/threonine kinase family protein [Plesiocystis pacifica SIR-1]|uniref:Serine/threonine kinase family protein n=1 Tax=Plesiocystis pacifica SIR-1 TaxID=391625 RepID=A6G9X6_9BACT|nr:serine/threonine-protein kinase [Plesiocystis pacifica]EDM77301.1 serine/threonine kinase family protein [Plesiocystis pacifica SIR-1]
MSSADATDHPHPPQLSDAERDAETLLSPGHDLDGAGLRGAFERGELIGRYLVLEEVGRGSMGVVLAAYDPELDRKVALKLLRVSGDPRRLESSRVRMLREAKAMASLAHPNVIAIHDVGSFGDAVFIAMEFVEGGSLRQWLAAPIKPRSWQTIVRTYIQAGEGLSAAHARGIVHRDFKPDNALVHGDGRVGVGDFGLARLNEHSGPRLLSDRDALADGLERLRETLSDSSTDQNLTHTGALLGTPAYMAPEQHLRAEVDGRADQFAFCVALWEALAGERPFSGRNPNILASKVLSGDHEPFPRDSPVPAPIRAALERGLSPAPGDRFASMRELLGALEAGLVKPPSPARRWAGIIVGLLATATFAGAVGYGSMLGEGISVDRPSLCSAAELRMHDVWDPDVRAVVEDRHASAQGFARASLDRAIARLDGLREEWIIGHTEACEATRVYGEQSSEMLDRRMTCLSQRRGEIAAVSSALREDYGADQTEASRALLESVDQLLATVGSIDGCADLTLLEAEGEPPPAERRSEVELLRWRLSDLEVRHRRMGTNESMTVAADLVRDAEALGYGPVLAEALLRQAQLTDLYVSPHEALPIARRSMAEATRSRHRRGAVRAQSLIAWIEGAGRGNHEFGLWLLDQASAELGALGQPRRETLRVMTDRAALQYSSGDITGALEQFQAALAFAESHYGAQHLRAADLRFNIATMHLRLGNLDKGEQGLRRALEVYTQLMGPEHPEVAQIHTNLTAVLDERGETEEARMHAERAIEIWKASGADARLSKAYVNLASVASTEGAYSEALELFTKAHALKAEVYGAAHPDTILTLCDVADSLRLLGRYDEAQARYDEALRHVEDLPPANGVRVRVHLDLVDLALSRGEHLDALARVDALAPAVTEQDPKSRESARLCLLRAKILVALDRKDEATATLREGLERYTSSGGALRKTLELLLLELSEPS